MVNASLNWASLQGILLFIWSLPVAITGGFQVYFILNKRADLSTITILKSIYTLLLLFYRILIYPLIGGILFFQGWRLDPILQFGTLMMIIALIYTSGKSVWYDYINWKSRKNSISSSINLNR